MTAVVACRIDMDGGTKHPDQSLIDALRRRDEAAFRDLVSKYHRSLTHVALQYVSSAAVAEEVVQDTWIAVIKGIDRFEGNSSLKTWIFRILQNQARTRGARDARIVPFSSITTGGDREVDSDRFLQSGPWQDHWSHPPRALAELPAERLEGRETRAAIEEAILRLPDSQQRVIWLRDVEGWSSDEVCETLGLSEGNQRVLLHRARSKVRGELERHLEEGLH